MRILVLGSGSREHCIVWKLLQSKKFTNLEILAAPGNEGIVDLAAQNNFVREENSNQSSIECIDLDIYDIDRLIEIALVRKVDLTIVGESELFELGIVDKFRTEGLLVVGPRKAAAQLESSRHFAKELMLKHGIPTTNFVCFDNYDLANIYTQSISLPFILKPNSALSKQQARIVTSHEQAQDALLDFFPEQQEKLKLAQNAAIKNFNPVTSLNIFGKNKNIQTEQPSQERKVIVEEYVEGAQYTITTICDGEIALSLLPVQKYNEITEIKAETPIPSSGADYGAYAPSPAITDDLMHQIRHQIINPMMQAMQASKSPYTGILAFDIVLKASNDNQEPQALVTDIHCNFGDSDSQVILPLFDEEFYEVLKACARDDLSFYKDGFHRYPGAALSVSISQPQIEFKPEALQKENEPNTLGSLLDFQSALQDDFESKVSSSVEDMGKALNAIALIFQGRTKATASNTRSDKMGIKTLGATAVAENLLDAQILAYKLVDEINPEGSYYKKDIGDQGML